MAKGSCGDYTVTKPIAHLNGITARLHRLGTGMRRPGTHFGANNPKK
jgi:hypothetical protein